MEEDNESLESVLNGAQETAEQPEQPETDPAASQGPEPEPETTEPETTEPETTEPEQSEQTGTEPEETEAHEPPPLSKCYNMLRGQLGFEKAHALALIEVVRRKHPRHGLEALRLPDFPEICNDRARAALACIREVYYPECGCTLQSELELIERESQAKAEENERLAKQLEEEEAAEENATGED